MKVVNSGGWSFEVYTGNTNVGIVLVHEIFGLDDYIRDVARSLTSNGVSVAAVDLYHGKYESSLQKARSLGESLTNEEIVDCMKNGLEILRKEINSETKKVGSMGFCMGGGVAMLGSSNLDFDFTIVYYGSLSEPEENEGLKNLNGPIILFEGMLSERDMNWAKDKFVPAVIKYSKRADIHFYPGAKHAFHRPGTELSNPVAAKDAWDKTLRFISQISPS